jgi:hypothetical protein
MYLADFNVIPFSTASNTDLMQHLLHLPTEICNKIYFMWHDAKDFYDNEADEIAEAQFLNDRERADDIPEDQFSEDYWDCDGWHQS